MVRSDFITPIFFVAGRETVCYLSPKPPFCKGGLFFSILCPTKKMIRSDFYHPYFFVAGERQCVTHPLNPPDLRSSSLRLGRVYKHPMHSVWRRLCKGGLYFRQTNPLCKLHYSFIIPYERVRNFDVNLNSDLVRLNVLFHYIFIVHNAKKVDLLFAMPHRVLFV